MSSLQASPHKISHFAHKIPKTIALTTISRLIHRPFSLVLVRGMCLARECSLSTSTTVCSCSASADITRDRPGG